MANAEARKMSPEEMSGPESERKLRRVESGSESAEGKEKSAGDRFLEDAKYYGALNAKAEAKKSEISRVEKQIPPGADPTMAKAALEKELKSLHGAMDKVSEKYGDNAAVFRFEAITLDDLNMQVEKKKARIAEISKIDAKDWAGGEKGQDMILEALQNQVARLGAESLRLEQKLKQNYDENETLGRVAIAGVFDEEIDALLEPLAEKEQAAVDEAKAQDLENAFMARGEKISAAHESGKRMRSTETEARGARAESLREMTEQQEQTSMEAVREVAILKQELDRARKALEASGVTNADEFMAKRSIGGGMGKAKDFFGGLFNKAKREMNRAADAYQEVTDRYTAAVEKVERNQQLTPEQRAVKQVQSESRR